MTRLAGPLLICGLVCWSATAHAQTSVTLPSPPQPSTTEPPSTEAPEPTFASRPADAAEPLSQASTSPPSTSRASGTEPSFAPRPLATAPPPSPPAQGGNPPTADDICRTIEESAAENGIPVEFFARVIWQESRFNAFAVSNKGAQGIAQFMPQTAGARGLADPFDPIQALHHSAGYLHELLTQSRAGGRRLQCRPRPGQRLACRQEGLAGRDPQLCRHHYRLDRGRMGVAVAAAEVRNDNSAWRAVHAACQSDPGAEG
jgi:hypothetical protein